MTSFSSAASRLCLLLLALGPLAACSQPAEEEFVWDLPADYPTPLVPEDNPISNAKVELGRHLFFDQRLSQNQTLACANCHRQEFAFSDPRALSVGSTGEELIRNSMTLTNVAYRSSFTWVNPVLENLEEQALVPLLGEFPVEMGLSGHEQEVMDRLAQLPLYQELFLEAYGDTEVNLTRVVQGLASFQRTLLSFDSPYDRFLDGDADALNEEEKLGYELFFSERTECYHCHGGPDFTNSYRHSRRKESSGEFRNNALYNIDGDGAYPLQDQGLYEFSLDAADRGRFRVPTLRNLKFTAPYMHDGSIATLEEVVEHYVQGGRLIETGENQGDGSQNPHRDPLIFPLNLDASEKAALVAFLLSLSDESFTTNPRYANPFP